MKQFKIHAFADEASKFIDDQIKAMKRNSLTGLEIRNVDGENVSKISLEKAKEVKSKLDAEGLTTFSIGSPIGKIKIDDDFESHLDLFKHCLEIAHILEAKKFRLFSFYTPKGEDPTPYKDEVFERLSRFCQAAKGSGVVLCHENEKGIYGDIASRCLEIHNAVPELKAVFDPANFVQCGQNTLEAYELLKDHIEYLHIKDALEDSSIVPAGKGIGNIEKILSMTHASELTLEPHLKVFDGLSALEDNSKSDEEKLKNVYSYSSNDEAFDAACKHLKELIR